MSSINFLDTVREVQNLILEYIENEGDEEENFKKIKMKFDNNPNLLEEENYLSIICHLLSNINNNHCFTMKFSRKINNIAEILNVKVKNINPKLKISLQNREINKEDEICYLIRRDSVDDFIQFFKKDPKYNINYEVYLFSYRVSLIEYAAYFGSIQIFQNLLKNGAEIRPSSVWIYAIKGNNSDMINILVDQKIEPEDKSYQICLEESIKCYNLNLAQYFLDNFVEDDSKISFLYGLKHCNFQFMRSDLFQMTDLPYDIFLPNKRKDNKDQGEISNKKYFYDVFLIEKIRIKFYYVFFHKTILYWAIENKLKHVVRILLSIEGIDFNFIYKISYFLINSISSANFNKIFMNDLNDISNYRINISKKILLMKFRQNNFMKF